MAGLFPLHYYDVPFHSGGFNNLPALLLPGSLLWGIISQKITTHSLSRGNAAITLLQLLCLVPHSLLDTTPCQRLAKLSLRSRHDLERLQYLRIESEDQVSGS